MHDLKNYLSDVTAPHDFKPFWEDQLTEARSFSCVQKRTLTDFQFDLVQTFDVTFQGFEGEPIHGWLTMPPSHASPRGGVVEFLGYGRGRGIPIERLHWANAGYAHFLMDTRGQGSEYGSGGSTPDAHGSGPAADGFFTKGILSPKTYYYTRLITDAVRAVEALSELTELDVSQCIAVGNSQGGGVALAVAGLVPELGGLMSSVPLLSDCAQAIMTAHDGPYLQALKFLSIQRAHTDAALDTLRYVDGVNFARCAQAPALFSVGMRDTICPPHSVFAAFNNYGTSQEGTIQKHLEVYPYNHHEGGDATHIAKQLEWLKGLELPRA